MVSVDTDQCWLYAGSKTPDGYGQIRLDGKYQKVHKLIYEAFNGELPEGYETDHLCEVKACVNPKHLEGVTHRENTRRHYERFYSEFCRNGHPRSMTKYYWDNRTLVYAKQCSGCYTQRYRNKVRMLQDNQTKEEV